MSIQINQGNVTTTEWPFTNDVNEENFEAVESLGYSWPLCGYPTEYTLVNANEGDLLFDFTVTGSETGEVTIECDSSDTSLANSTFTVKVKAWRMQVDQNGVETEAGIGYG